MASMMATLTTTKVQWWVILIQSIAMLILGLLFLTAPAATLINLVFFLGIYWLIEGLLDIVSIFLDRTAWVWKLLGGIIGILAGLFILQHPLWSAALVPTFLVTLLGIMGIVMGFTSIIRAFQGDGWGAGVLGIFSILFGLLLVGNSLVIGVIALPLLLGIFGVIGGIVGIWQAFQVKRAQGA